MAELGKYTLIKIGDEVIPAQMDSQLSFTSGIIETTEISGANRFKTFEYDEKEGDCSLSVQKSETTESLLFNAWYNANKVTVWYGGVNIGEKYYLFDALITGINKSDPNTGISMLSVSLKPTGIIQRLTVSDEGGQTWALTVTVTGSGTVDKSPDKTNYDDGESVILTPIANTGSVFWKSVIGGVFSPLTPVSLLMDSDKSIEFIFGTDEFDYLFDQNSGDDWQTLPDLPFTVTYSAITYLTVTADAVGSQYFYTPILLLDLSQIGFSPKCFNRVRVYFDNTNFNFYVNMINSNDNSTASSGEITPSNEPVFTKTFTELKYCDSIEIRSSIFNTTFALMRISRIILDIV